MKEIRKRVEQILLNYPNMQREVKVLLFELQRFSPIIHADRVTDLTFAQSFREHVSAPGHSDKTANMAIDHFDAQINGEYHALRTIIGNMQHELRRVDYYLTLIPENEAAIIRSFYFCGISLGQMAETSQCSLRSLERHKAKGLENLVHCYSMLDKWDMGMYGVMAEMRFISYLHEERFARCLELAKVEMSLDVKAMLYIISGCNALWDYGIEKCFDFETGTPMGEPGDVSELPEDTRALLALAHHLAKGLNSEDIVHTLRYYFTDLEFVHLELAIEALRLALFPEKS
jgi:hypothetical protein